MGIHHLACIQHISQSGFLVLCDGHVVFRFNLDPHAGVGAVVRVYIGKREGLVDWRSVKEGGREGGVFIPSGGTQSSGPSSDFSWLTYSYIRISLEILIIEGADMGEGDEHYP